MASVAGHMQSVYHDAARGTQDAGIRKQTGRQGGLLMLDADVMRASQCGVLELSTVDNHC